MKALKIIPTAAIIGALAFSLTACGSTASDSADDTTQTTETTETAESTTASTTASGYTVTLNDVTIVMNAEASGIIDELGDDYSYFESESCAFEGLDKVYSYSGFKLNTYPVDDVDYVSSVVFMDDTVETDEGIFIGSSEEDVLAAYGEATTSTDAVLKYEKGDTTLTIGISDGKVTALEIAAVTE